MSVDSDPTFEVDETMEEDELEVVALLEDEDVVDVVVVVVWEDEVVDVTVDVVGLVGGGTSLLVGGGEVGCTEVVGCTESDVVVGGTVTVEVDVSMTVDVSPPVVVMFCLFANSTRLVAFVGSSWWTISMAVRSSGYTPSWYFSGTYSCKISCSEASETSTRSSLKRISSSVAGTGGRG